MRRIGVLTVFPADDPQARAWIKALLEGLKELSWVEGRNIRIDERWAGADHSRLLALANELIAKPDLIVAAGGPAAAALAGGTRSLPIVFVQVVDPVAFALVRSRYFRSG